MCRLAITILEEIDKKNKVLNNFLNEIVIDRNNKNIYENMDDSFDLYIDISKNACNGIPHELLQHDMF